MKRETKSEEIAHTEKERQRQMRKRVVRESERETHTHSHRKRDDKKDIRQIKDRQRQR
jgi:hypothetical protein